MDPDVGRCWFICMPSETGPSGFGGHPDDDDDDDDDVSATNTPYDKEYQEYHQIPLLRL